MSGIPDLNRAIAEHQRRFYDLDYDPETEITVYSGATEAICATFQALCDVGDEVVLFEPFYDSYRASVTMAGAVPRIVTLRAPDFSYRPEELEAAISPKTRAILLNSPHNPTGKVFNKAELEHIAGLCREHDLIAITDEVYEHLVYEGTHVPLASLPGMRERTVLISSWQDLQLHRLEGRTHVRPAGNFRRAAQRPSIRDLLHGHARSSTPCPRLRRRRPILHATSPPSTGPAATACATACERSASACSPPPAPTS
jgi:hypothetical protein